MSETYLEKALIKLARQINAYDEASLMSLWEKYAEKVRRFEPTKRWEEAVLIFNLIQSARLKNQLFNYNWARSRKPDEPGADIDLAALTAPEPVIHEVEAGPKDAAGRRQEGDSHPDRKGKLLTLTPKNKK
ncbi:MAG: hypothetical protein PHP91_15515 [Pseudodesulfovibrio sp.]|nr:hypothetical protein [Pseudodesulfovibrio sp.]MDD3313539.1 hypothetical protein [Pseudodesulfovibrio sp.]